MPILRLENVHKSYDGTQALRGIDLEIERGHTVAIIGPSGSGKTTLLRCIGLLDKIDQGAIYIDSQPVITTEPGKAPQVHVDLNEHRRRVGMVFQHLYVWPHLTVLGNLTLAPRIVTGSEGTSVVERAMALLDKMGIADKANKYTPTLSGGQQQRVALARALMMKPEILLLDEITSALDPELVGEVLDIIADLSRSGMTMLIVTHEMLFASEVADRVLFIDGGTLIEQGPPSDMILNPRTTRLQKFLQRIQKHRRSGATT